MADEINKPVILILGLGDEIQQYLTTTIWADLLWELEAAANVKQATTSEDAMALMDLHPNPRGIFIPDPGITVEKNQAVSERVVQYVRMGGIAVFGGVLSSLICPPDFEQYFDKTWFLPWAFSDYYRSTFPLNRSSLGNSRSHLPSYSQKAVILNNVQRKSAWYLTDYDSSLASSGNGPEDYTDAPTVFHQAGEGWLGYTGDVNGEEETTAVVLEMFRLRSTVDTQVPSREKRQELASSVPNHPTEE